MDYTGLVKSLAVPEGWSPPTELRHEDIRAFALTREHLSDDVRGINASLDLIRRTRGGSWPTEAVTEDFNYVDLVWHECEFREGESYTYAVYDAEGHYLGCCYLYPVGRRTPLTQQLLEHDVDVSWWVTPDAYEKGSTPSCTVRCSSGSARRSRSRIRTTPTRRSRHRPVSWPSSVPRLPGRAALQAVRRRRRRLVTGVQPGPEQPVELLARDPLGELLELAGATDAVTVAVHPVAGRS